MSSFVQSTSDQNQAHRTAADASADSAVAIAKLRKARNRERLVLALLLLSLGVWAIDDIGQYLGASAKAASVQCPAAEPGPVSGADRL